LNIPAGYEGGMGNPNNIRLVRNLVTFGGPMPRARGTKVWMEFGLQAVFGPADIDAVVATILSTGLTVEHANLHSGTRDEIPSTVKVVFLWMPSSVYSRTDANALKRFAAEGGRIVFMEDFRFPTANNVLASLGVGARFINITSNEEGADCPSLSPTVIPASSIRRHQITAGLTGLAYRCAVPIRLGPADQPLLLDTTGDRAFGATVVMNVKPIPAPDP
jgi:hypothetical protein